LFFCLSKWKNKTKINLKRKKKEKIHMILVKIKRKIFIYIYKLVKFIYELVNLNLNECNEKVKLIFYF
jgi:hypothetical protein